MVLSKLQPYRNQKLSLKYFGHFPVIERVGVIIYYYHPLLRFILCFTFHCSNLAKGTTPPNIFHHHS
ncbi:hypothetical protein CR513_02449, partial [Mucuna pruriens]